MTQPLAPRPDALAPINHIIVLMLENRSFDNLLGWLYDGRTPPRNQPFEGLTADLWNPLDSLSADGIPVIEKVPIKKNGAPILATRYIKGEPHPPPDYQQPRSDPGEGFRDTNHQLFEHYQVPESYPPEPTNRGFVNNFVNTIVNGAYRTFGESIVDPRDIMTCYTPDQVPVLATLAREFAVCDQWFASVPSQTFPNRKFFHAGTSEGQVNNAPQVGCGARTIFNQMQDAIDQGKPLRWNVYTSTPTADAPGPVATETLTRGGQETSITRLLMTQLQAPRFTDNFLPVGQFYVDAAAGNLPNYAFIEPQFFGAGQNDQHPPADIRPGEQLIARVYEALRDSPQWEQTLLVITYDEHGGCYDHVPPPNHARHPDGRKGAPGQDGFTFSRYGVRVPTVLVSPWIEAGTIARPAGQAPFEHTSVIATVQRCFGLDGHLTARDAAAPDLSSVLTRPTPRPDKPTVAPLAWNDAAHKIHVNDLHRTLAAHLADLTGLQPGPNQHIHDFIQAAYAAHFGT